MPKHRFCNELIHLEDNPLRGSYAFLIVGTFNSEDQEGLENNAEWFYGRCQGEFWYLFPQLLGLPSLHQRENPDMTPRQLASHWRNFCTQNRTVIVDVYKSIGGNLPNHGDAAIENPVAPIYFDYKRAFANVNFEFVVFTWKSRTQKHLLGQKKQEIHIWFEQKGSKILHMPSPSYSYPKSKEFKLETWLQLFNDQQF